VDSSGSVQKSYNQQKIVLSDILSNIDIGNETHRVALLQFAGFKIQKTEWTYNSFADGPTLIKAVENIRHFTGTTFLGAALNSARQVLEQRRRGIPSLVILLSDGINHLYNRLDNQHFRIFSGQRNSSSRANKTDK
jgi:Mg-chelatase subunit ChlD